jgi:hypothetical protein
MSASTDPPASIRWDGLIVLDVVFEVPAVKREGDHMIVLLRLV